MLQVLEFKHVDIVCALCACRKHAATTACTPQKRHVRYKEAVGTSCGRCRDAVRTFCVYTI